MIHPNFVKRVSAYLLLVLFVFMNLSTSVFAVITDGADALTQLGQPDFDTGSSGTGADEFNYAYLVEVDTINHRLFVADANNDRVQIFNLDDSNDFLASKTAFATLGQNYTASSTAPGLATAMNIDDPTGLAYDSANERLFVTALSQSRVMVFDVSVARIAGSGSGYSADAVIGQKYFESETTAATQSNFNSPNGIAYDSVGERLFVTEYSNNRVTVFDASPAKLAASATGIGESVNATAVIGQASFTTSTNGTTQDKFKNPYYIEYAGSGASARIFVADTNNHRVMIFSASSAKLAASASGDGEILNASYVLGQTDFVTGAGGSTQNELSYPADLAYDSDSDLLFITDGNNNRVVAYDASEAKFIASGSGYNAENVLGQNDFSTNAAGTDINSIDYAEGIAVDTVSNKLFVADSNNHRILTFDNSPTASIPEFSTTVFSLVLLVLGFAIIQKSGGFKKLMGNKV